MRKLLIPLLAGAMLAGGLTASPALAQQKRGDQESARKEMRAGNVLSLRQIEGQVVPRMRGQQYLGPAYDSTAMAYRLKFIDRNGLSRADHLSKVCRTTESSMDASRGTGQWGVVRCWVPITERSFRASSEGVPGVAV